MAAGAGADGPQAMSGSTDRTAAVPADETARTATPADPATPTTPAAAGGGVHPRSEVASVAAGAKPTPDAKAVGTKPTEAAAASVRATPAETAAAMVEDALRLPDAVEDTAAFVPRPGSPAAEPAVQAAKVEAEAARAALATELSRLKESAAATVDIKAKVRDLPAAIAADPRKAVGVGAVGAGAVALLRGLRGGRRKPAMPGLLPPEVEAVLGDAAADPEKVREALRAGFTSYLEAHGAEVAKPRRRVKGIVPLLVLPVASTVAREAIKRSLRGPSKG